LALAFTYLAIATGPLLAQGAQTQTGAFDGKGEAANVFFGADKVG
jgi:hypothetical protein